MVVTMEPMDPSAHSNALVGVSLHVTEKLAPVHHVSRVSMVTPATRPVLKPAIKDVIKPLETVLIVVMLVTMDKSATNCVLIIANHRHVKSFLEIVYLMDARLASSFYSSD